MSTLVITETHPIQYHAPVWRQMVQEEEVPLQVIYGGDFSVQGYRDREFGQSFKWDQDLLSGYASQVLRPMAQGGPSCYEEVTAKGLDAALLQAQPAALLIQGYHHVWDRAALRWARQQHVPVLFRGETSDAPRPGRALWKSLLRDALLRRLYRRFSACLYLGQGSRAHYERLGVPAERLIHSPYCVSTASFELEPLALTGLRDSTRQELAIPEDAFVMIFSGKLSRRKGVDLIPLAVRQMPFLRGRQVVLLFLGAGELQEELRQLCAEPPQVEVRFTGFQNQSQLSRFYAVADLLVLPSRELETWGLVVNEALHHGLPCVVSRAVGSAPDLIEPAATGEVFATNSVAALAEALDRCARYATLPATADRCRAQVAAYSISQAASGIALAWKRLNSGDLPVRR